MWVGSVSLAVANKSDAVCVPQLPAELTNLMARWASWAVNTHSKIINKRTAFANSLQIGLGKLHIWIHAMQTQFCETKEVLKLPNSDIQVDFSNEK